MAKQFKFWIYKVIGKTEVTTENQDTIEEAREFVLKNAQYFTYNKPEYFYVCLDKEAEVVK